MFMLFGICNPIPINVDCKSTEMEKAAEAKDIRLKAFNIAQGVSPGSGIRSRNGALTVRHQNPIVPLLQSLFLDGD